MSTAPVPRFTQEEYLRFERESDRKHEFIEGEIVAMAGGTRAHSLIASNLLALLHQRLSDRCEVHGSDLRVCLGEGQLISYPDVTIVCGTPEFLPEDKDTLVNPSLLVEVLSPSTQSYDKLYKALMFRKIPSMRAYLLVSQTPVEIECWERQTESEWTVTYVSDPAAVVRIRQFDIEAPVAEIYRRVQP